jgi:excisionase family DNA binding protein
MDAADREYLSPDDLADLLRTSRDAVYRMLRRDRGMPQPFRLGRRMLWRRADIVAWLAAKEAA